MKKKISALLMTAGLALGVFSGMASAQEPAPAEEAPVVEAEAAAADAEAAVEVSEDEQNAESARRFAETLIFSLAQTAPEELDVLRDTGSESMKIAIANWDGIAEEIGQPVEVGEQKVTLSEDGKVYTVVSDVKYDGVSDSTKVVDTVTLNQRTNEFKIDFDVSYPKGKLFGEAALNTLMGLGTVFLVLVFLSWLISNIHWIPDLLEKRSKKADAASPAVPVQAPVTRMNAAVGQSEIGEIVNDSELIAVIASAIAAYEGTTVEKVMEDGFIVRTIRRSNRENWLRA